MIQNIINSAFETVKTVTEGVEILDSFVHLSKRESIRRTIDKKTVQVYQLLSDELNAVKKELNSKKGDIPYLHPKYAGVANWARSLKKRIDHPVAVLQKAHFLPQVGLGEEIKVQYHQLSQSLDDFVRKFFNDWTNTVDKDTNKLLDSPLMCRSTEQQGMIDINYDR